MYLGIFDVHSRVSRLVQLFFRVLSKKKKRPRRAGTKSHTKSGFQTHSIVIISSAPFIVEEYTRWIQQGGQSMTQARMPNLPKVGLALLVVVRRRVVCSVVELRIALRERERRGEQSKKNAKRVFHAWADLLACAIWRARPVFSRAGTEPAYSRVPFLVAPMAPTRCRTRPLRLSATDKKSSAAALDRAKRRVQRKQQFFILLIVNSLQNPNPIHARFRPVIFKIQIKI